MAQEKSTSQIVLINYYRGFAAISVLLYHVSVEIRNRFYDAHYYNILKVTSFGVDFFFVLSGFIIFYIHHEDIGQSTRIASFLRKRFVRIFPVYWILLTIALVAFVVTKTNIAHSSADMTPQFIARAYLLFPIAAPILTPAWTLSYEIFFYGLFALLIAVRQTKLLLALLGLYILLLLVGNFVFTVPLSITNTLWGWGNVFVSSLVIEFFVGVGAGYLFFKLPAFSPKTAEWLIFIAGALLLSDWISELTIPSWEAKYRLFSFALPAALLLVASAKLEQTKSFKKIRVLKFLGDASYSIYLAQAFLLLVFFKIIYLSHIPTTTLTKALYAGTAVVFTLMMAGMFHSLVEKKILKRLKR